MLVTCTRAVPDEVAVQPCRNRDREVISHPFD
jgi:hypothetical protein